MGGPNNHSQDESTNEAEAVKQHICVLIRSRTNWGASRSDQHLLTHVPKKKHLLTHLDVKGSNLSFCSRDSEETSFELCDQASMRELEVSRKTHLQTLSPAPVFGGSIRTQNVPQCNLNPAAWELSVFICLKGKVMLIVCRYPLHSFLYIWRPF